MKINNVKNFDDCLKFESLFEDIYVINEMDLSLIGQVRQYLEKILIAR